MLWVLLLAMVIACNGWLRSGCLVPYLVEREPEYLLLLPSVLNLAGWFIASLAILTVARRWIRHLSPLLLLTLPPVAVALLATPLARVAGPFLYVSVDLFWWLVAAVVALVVIELRPAISIPSGSQRGFYLTLATVLAAGSLLASPRLRFQSVLVGDEPKYLRYLENWYRGRGMDVSNLGPIAEMPGEPRSHVVGNFDRLAAAVAHAGGDLTADTRRLAGMSAPPRPGPATSQGGWFVDGKRGGVYQVHNPGISFLLFPGYLVDRGVSRTQLWHPQFPTDLYGTGAIVLLLYVLWGLSTFGFVRTGATDAWPSWIVTVVVFLSLPVCAFAYQYYPEVAAGLGGALLFRYALSGDRQRITDAAHGFLAGFLPWLHVRFLPWTLGVAVILAVRRRHDRPAIASFAASLALPIAALAVYDYHITGNLMPWALYELIPDGTLFWTSRAWREFPAVWLDRTWGLLAHAPIYLFALPGLVLLWRKNRVAATVLVLAVLTIAIPAAGHGYTGAFTTPSRLIAAALPLLALPIAETLTSYAASRGIVAVFALMSVISVQNGLTYNVHLIKSEASLHAATIGGWLFPLLLPDFGAPSGFTYTLALLWCAVAGALISLPFVRPRPRIATRSWPLVSATVVIVFAAAAAILGAIGGARGRPEFTLNAGDARDRIIHVELTRPPAFRWSSTKGAVDVRTYFPNPEGTSATFGIEPEQPAAGAPLALTLEVRRPGNRPGWGTALVDFGDGAPPARVPIEGTARARHTYAQPGDYAVTVEFHLWGLNPRAVVRRLHVGPP